MLLITASGLVLGALVWALWPHEPAPHRTRRAHRGATVEPPPARGRPPASRPWARRARSIAIAPEPPDAAVDAAPPPPVGPPTDDEGHVLRRMRVGRRLIVHRLADFERDAGPTDAGPTGAGPTDAGPTDAGPTDAGPTDAGLGSGGLVLTAPEGLGALLVTCDEAGRLPEPTPVAALWAEGLRPDELPEDARLLSGSPEEEDPSVWALRFEDPSGEIVPLRVRLPTAPGDAP